MGQIMIRSDEIYNQNIGIASNGYHLIIGNIGLCLVRCMMADGRSKMYDGWQKRKYLLRKFGNINYLS